MYTEIFDLGKIGITLGGEYDNKVVYEKLTIVLYKGKSYISTKTTQGVSPEQNILVWQLIAEAKDAYHMLVDAGKTTLTEEEFLEQLVDATKGRYIITGNLVNAADEEDLTIEHSDLLGIDTLKLANRDNTNGMGYVILRKNKSFVEQVTKENTIYEIRYDFNLNGQKITIPNRCILKFEGGSFANGTIIGHNTEIETGLYAIFKHDIILGGTWNVDEAYAEWFDEPIHIGATKALDYFNNLYFVSNKNYNIEGTITVNNSNTVVSSKGKSTLIYTLAEGALFYFNGDIRQFFISNLTLIANRNANDNTAYCFKSDQGHAQSRYSNLLIRHFKYGFYNESKPIWDINYSSIRCSFNYIAFYNNAKSSINLCFETFYFD